MKRIGNEIEKINKFEIERNKLVEKLMAERN